MRVGRSSPSLGRSAIPDSGRVKGTTMTDSNPAAQAADRRALHQAEEREPGAYLFDGWSLTPIEEFAVQTAPAPNAVEPAE